MGGSMDTGGEQWREIPAAEDTRESLAAERAEMVELWERYRTRTFEKVTLLEQAAAKLLVGDLDRLLQDQAREEAHRLAGSVGSFGYTEGSRLAREIESVLQGSAPTEHAETQHLAALIAALRMDLERPPPLP